MKRKLGNIETLMTVMHEKFGGATQAMPVVSLSRCIDFRTFYESTQAVFDKYGMLQCRINFDGRRHSFVGDVIFEDCDVIDYGVHSMSELDSIVLRELHKPVDPAHSCWRLALVHCRSEDRSAIFFVCHHAIIDTQGFYAVLDDVLNFVSSIIDGKPLYFEKLPIAKCVDEFLDTKISPSVTERAVPISYSQFALLGERRTKYLRGSLSTDIYDKIKRKCERKKLRFHSMLVAAMCVAAVNQGISSTRTTFKTAVSLREWVAGKSDLLSSLGCFVAVANTVLDISSVNLESIARSYQKLLMQEIMQESVFNKSMDLHALSKFLEDDENCQSFNQGIGISNLGSIDITKEHKHFTVEDFLPLTNRIAGNHALAVHVWEWESTMNYMFMYSSPLMDDERISRAVSDFNAQLERWSDILIDSTEELI